MQNRRTTGCWCVHDRLRRLAAPSFLTTRFNSHRPKSYPTLLLGTCTIDNEPRNVAFKQHRRLGNKRLPQTQLNEILEEFRHEIKLMKKLRYHPNVVQIYGVTFAMKRPILVVELGHCTLSSYL